MLVDPLRSPPRKLILSMETVRILAGGGSPPQPDAPNTQVPNTCDCGGDTYVAPGCQPSIGCPPPTDGCPPPTAVGCAQPPDTNTPGCLPGLPGDVGPTGSGCGEGY